MPVAPLNEKDGGKPTSPPPEVVVEAHEEEDSSFEQYEFKSDYKSVRDIEMTKKSYSEGTVMKAKKV